MAAETQQDDRTRRDARAKKILLLLVPLLVILAVWQGPGAWKRVTNATDEAREKTESVQGDVVQGFQELAPSGVVTTTGEPGAPVELLASGALDDTDAAPEPAEGQLISFTRFDARDPFVQLVSDDSEPSPDESPPVSPAPPPSTGTTGGGTTTVVPDDGGTTTVPAAQASIRVNGTVTTVRVGETFPTSDPAFTLVAIEGGVAKIGLVAGSFSNGVQTIDLEVGDTVTLISQPDGARFTLKLVALA
jgi:hypothetical protein